MAYIATKDELDLLLTEKLERYYQKIVDALHGANLSQRKWLKAAELKKLLPLSDYRIAEMRIRGLLDFQKIGGTYYYTIDSINRLLNKNPK
jgi:hypothetical protein